MNLASAKKIAENYLSETETPEDFQYVILDECTIEKESLFVFFYQSSTYLESGDINDMLAGNAPILIDKRTAEIHLTGTAHATEFYIHNYEKFGSTEVD
jgi:hypothetical protein